LINPGEPIAPEIVTLTGIKDEDVVQMPSIVEGAKKLSEFKSRLQINPIGIVWGAGRSNDVRKIFDEAGVESPFKSRIIDVKGVFQMLANASGSKMRQKVGLGKACEIFGLGWDSKFGEQHHALADAFNTMRIYMFLSKCLKGAVEIKLG
jgi:DNA polymerase III epsilon subunit-like protein